MPAALKAYWANKRKSGGKAPKGTPRKLAAYHLRKKGGKQMGKLNAGLRAYLAKKRAGKSKKKKGK